MKDPVKIRLGTKKKAQGLGSKRRLVEKEEDFAYVPILQTLQALLTNETVLSEVKFNVCRVMITNNDFVVLCYSGGARPSPH